MTNVFPYFCFYILSVWRRQVTYVLKHVNICLVVPKENSTYHAEISEFLSFHLKVCFIFGEKVYINSAATANTSLLSL